jgi:hypothetical protein
MVSLKCQDMVGLDSFRRCYTPAIYLGRSMENVKRHPGAYPPRTTHWCVKVNLPAVCQTLALDGGEWSGSPSGDRRRSCSGNITDLYSVGSRFESRASYLLFWLKGSVSLLSFSKQILCLHLQIGHIRHLFTIHNDHPISSEASYRNNVFKLQMIHPPAIFIP